MGPVWFDAIYVLMTSWTLRVISHFTWLNLMLLPLRASQARTPSDDIAAHLSRSSQTEWMLTVRLQNGFILNSRVPEAQRLQLVTDERAWNTEDFILQPDSATLYIDKAAPSRAKLTAYICRLDLCKKVTVPVRADLTLSL